MTRSIVLGAAIAIALAAPAHAKMPVRLVSVPHDDRLVFNNYSPNKIYPLKTEMGDTLMIVFGKDEHIVKVAVSDSARIGRDVIKESGNRLGPILFLKPHPIKGDPLGYVLRQQPIQVVTQKGDELRRYQFVMEAQPIGGDPDYSVTFRYPHDAYEAHLAAERAAERRREAAETQMLLKRETQFPNSSGGFSGAYNYHYVGRGDTALQPKWIADNGYSTYFYFPAMQHIPSIFRGTCGTKGEATADYSTHGDMVIVPGTSPVWCLRDQHSAAEDHNLAWSPTGATPNTQTISPFVERVTVHAH